MAEGHALAVIGTDTGVGKTRVTIGLVRGLRDLGRPCWLHKPVACGGWDGRSSEDARALIAEVGDGQPPDSVCPRQFAEAASPHLAAAAAGARLDLRAMAGAITGLRGPHDLVVEGVGGLLVPLTPTRETLCDLLAVARLPVLLVTRPDLGTLNHTALTVAHLRRAGISVLGLVVNRARPCADDLATRSAATELAAVTMLPVLADLPYGAPANDMTLRDLAASVTARCIAHPAVGS